MLCPKCQHEQMERNAECARCGAIFSKVLDHDHPKTAAPFKAEGRAFKPDWRGILAVFALCIMAFFYLNSAASNLQKKPSSADNTAIERRSGGHSENIGHQDTQFGSARQASELLRIMRMNPGKSSYNIQYDTSADVVIFECDFDKDVIMRLHQTPDGHRTAEKWIGAINERLENASRGGSLNDTPLGRREGSFSIF